MRQFIYVSLCLGVSAIAVGCGSPCGDLQDICDTCEGDLKTMCEEVANADDDDACKADEARFESLCR